MKKLLAVLLALMLIAPGALAGGGPEDGGNWGELEASGDWTWDWPTAEEEEEDNVVYWTTNEDACYHSRKTCSGLDGVVAISESAALEFGKLPCAICTSGHHLPHRDAENYSTFEDTSFYREDFLPAFDRVRSGVKNYADIRHPVLVGSWVYYIHIDYSENEGDDFFWDSNFADAVISIRRCPVDDLSAEEIIVADTEVGLIDGLLDTGTDLLLWYSDFKDGDKYYTAKFWRLSYDGKTRKKIAEVQTVDYTTSVVLVDDTVWFNSTLSTWEEDKGGKGAIYKFSLDNPKPEKVYDSPGTLYKMDYAYGKLYFMMKKNMSDTLKFCTFDPDTEEMSVLYELDAAPGDGEGKRYTILGGRMYLWDNAREAMISMNLDGSNIIEISRDRFGFRQIWKGYVIATNLRKAKSVDQWYNDDSFYVYYPQNIDWPDFDPDACKKLHVGNYDFMLGDWFFQYDAETGWKTTYKG